jgi:tRNA threonylcarbamoyladenosine dehydratase
MTDYLSRSELLLGPLAIAKLKTSNVLVVGLGGVGSYAAEALARAGVGKLTIVDGDTVATSNINRQLQALHSSVDKPKTGLMAQRILDINPEIVLTEITQFLQPEDIQILLTKDFDWVLDCIDSVSPKLELIKTCKQRKIKFISAMGAGGKLDPSRVSITDINLTKECYFSREIRKRLRREGYNYGIKVVYSDEVVSKDKMEQTDGTNFKKSYYGTISYMPAIFGLTMASYVIRKIVEPLATP